jgi:hypothetical protein
LYQLNLKPVVNPPELAVALPEFVGEQEIPVAVALTAGFTD